ncbi:MAG TPA: hypothetical protein VLX92_35415, partial [Kofleriaceae bacterium]|nr:hypothetical protein [Kofleriaceae bacterium]
MQAGRALVGLVIAACGHGSSPASPDARGPTADAYVPTQSHALGMNDIAWLVQLPPDATQTTFAPMTGFSGGPELVSRAVFDQLVTAPGDVTASYEQFQLVAMRFDVCDRGAGPCPAGADGRLRLVFQPIDDLMPSVAADDVALHALYPIPAADLAPVVDELRALAAIQDFPTDAPLAINQT